MTRIRNKVGEFMKQLFPSPSPDDEKSGGARILERLHRELPELVASFEYSAEDDVSPESVQPFERAVLTVVGLLHGEGNVVMITNKIKDLSSKEIPLSRTLLSLDRLERQGLLTSEFVQKDNSDRTVRVYKMTPRGERARMAAAPAEWAIEKREDFA